MKQVTLLLEPAAALFYARIAELAALPLETVLSDALFKLAAELSLESLKGHPADRSAVENGQGAASGDA